MNHDQAAELLGVHALDAVDTDEVPDLEEHLTDCRDCQAELTEHQQMAALIANGGDDASSELWDRISTVIQNSPRHQEKTPSLPEVLASMRGDSPAMQTRSITPRLRILTAVLAMAAAVAIVVLGVQVGSLDHKVSHLNAATATRTVQTMNLQATSAGSQDRAKVELTSAGLGYFEDSTLPQLKKDKTYQLWEIRGDTMISLGNLGTNPNRVPFSIGVQKGSFRIAVTEEPAGGSAQPTSEPLLISAA